jgi:hypothetical protein
MPYMAHLLSYVLVSFVGGAQTQNGQSLAQVFSATHSINLWVMLLPSQEKESSSRKVKKIDEKENVTEQPGADTPQGMLWMHPLYRINTKIFTASATADNDSFSTVIISKAWLARHQ